MKLQNINQNQNQNFNQNQIKKNKKQRKKDRNYYSEDQKNYVDQNQYGNKLKKKFKKAIVNQQNQQKSFLEDIIYHFCSYTSQNPCIIYGNYIIQFADYFKQIMLKQFTQKNQNKYNKQFHIKTNNFLEQLYNKLLNLKTYKQKTVNDSLLFAVQVISLKIDLNFKINFKQLLEITKKLDSVRYSVKQTVFQYFLALSQKYWIDQKNSFPLNNNKNSNNYEIQSTVNDYKQNQITKINEKSRYFKKKCFHKMRKVFTNSSSIKKNFINSIKLIKNLNNLQEQIQINNKIQSKFDEKISRYLSVNIGEQLLTQLTLNKNNVFL